MRGLVPITVELVKTEKKFPTRASVSAPDACGGKKTNRIVREDGAAMFGFDLALFELLMHIQESAPFLIVPDVFMG
jgi:hypothetical protein